MWEKEKLLVTSNFSFSHSVFYLFVELSAIFIKSEIVVCKIFQFGRVYNMSFGKGLIFVDASVNYVKFSNFPNSRANNSGRSSPRGFIIKLIRDLLVIHILAKFDADWSMFADARVKMKLIIAVFLIQAQRSMFSVLIRSEVSNPRSYSRIHFNHV